MKTSQQYLSRFWADDRSLSHLLVLTVVEFFLLPPLRGLDMRMAILSQMAFALLLVSGVQAVSKNRTVRWSASILVAVAWLINLLRHVHSSSALQIADYFSTGVVLGLFVHVLLCRVLGDGESNGFRIQGAIAAFILMAVTWGHFYALISAWIPGSFNAPAGYLEPDRLLESMTFFSTVTLTTVGYGDITPVGPLARSLACLEMYLGVLYPAVLVGRLVALNVPSPISPSDPGLARNSEAVTSTNV